MKPDFFSLPSVIVLFSALIFFSSCASSTLIKSEPPGAELYIDGRHVGRTPFLHTDTKIVGSRTSITLEKEGYEPLNTYFTRSEEADVGAIIGGIFVWPVFLWVMKYYPEHSYELWPLMRDDNNENKYILAPESEGKSKVERLRELKQLLDEKIITESEFQKEKEKILKEDEK